MSPYSVSQNWFTRRVRFVRCFRCIPGLLSLLAIQALAVMATAEPTPFDEELAYTSTANTESVAWTAITSEDRQPPDVTVGFETVSDTPQYVELRYGSPGSIRVCMLIDIMDDGSFSLYADSNRDRRIEANELIRGEGRERSFELMVRDAGDLVAQGDGEKSTEIGNRRFAFRLGRTLHRHYVATQGAMAGLVRFNDRDVSVQLVDANANGVFVDRVDRLRLDLDGDGMFHAFQEQFPIRPILLIDDVRYQVALNAFGKTLQLSEATEVGSLKLAIEMFDYECEIVALHAVVVGEDGCAYAIHDQDSNQLPAGGYHVSSVSLVLADAHGQRWGYAFMFGLVDPADYRFQIASQATTEIDLLKEPKFQFREASFRPDGEHAVACPHLTLRNGLYLTYCGPNVLDTSQGSSSGRTTVVNCTDPTGRSLGTKISGFS